MFVLAHTHYDFVWWYMWNWICKGNMCLYTIRASNQQFTSCLGTKYSPLISWTFNIMISMTIWLTGTHTHHCTKALSCAQQEEMSLFADSTHVYTKRQTLVCDSSCIGKLGSTYSSLSHILTHLLCRCKGTLSCVWYRHHRRQLKALEMEWKTIGTVPARTPWQVSVLAQSQRSTLSGTSTLTVKDCMLPVPRNSSLAWCGAIAQPTTGLHWHLDQMQKCIVSQSLQPATTVHAPIAHWTKQLLNSTCACKVGQFFCLFSLGPDVVNTWSYYKPVLLMVSVSVEEVESWTIMLENPKMIYNVH